MSDDDIIDISPRTLMVNRVTQALIDARVDFSALGWTTIDKIASESPYVATGIQRNAEIAVDALSSSGLASRALAERYRAARMRPSADPDQQGYKNTLIEIADQLVYVVLNDA